MINVIHNMKKGKAPGIDNITVELIKNGGSDLLERIFDLLMQIWDQERMPEEWEIGVICPIFKKGDRRECSNYRGITLLNTVYKIFTCLIYNRLVKYSEMTLGEYQSGFRPSRSTVDQIHVVRQILEKCYEYGIELHNIFIDFKQAMGRLLPLRIQQNGMNVSHSGKHHTLTKQSSRYPSTRDTNTFATRQTRMTIVRSILQI